MDQLQPILFWVLAFWTGFSAIGVVVTQNIVRCAVWLLLTLAGVSGIFFLIGADFVGATQLFVYVGGTLVLVVFGVMLTAQGPFITMKVSAPEWFVATVVGLLLFTLLALSTFLTNWPKPGDQDRMNDVANSRSSVVLGAALLSVEDATPKAKITGWPEKASKPAPPLPMLSASTVGMMSAPSGHGPVLAAAALDPERPHPLQIEGKPPPERERVGYLLPFEIVSVHLLVVLIGAAYLARAKRRRGAPA
jgi:NADH:ubiquinone oxidoreductase subunit 6 (subunit J)